MSKRGASIEYARDLVRIEVDGKEFQVPDSYTLSTALSYAVGLNYRKTRKGKVKSPICNMGVCYECSIHLEGVGITRACMVKVSDGMRIKTDYQLADYKDDRGQGREEDPEGGMGEAVPDDLRFFDLAIIGAGPAGLGAADELKNEDLRIVMIDEQQKAGGQIYRQPLASGNNENPNTSLIGKALKVPGLHTIFGSTVWSVLSVNSDGEIASSPEEHDRYRIYLDNGRIAEAIYIVIASGAYDRLIPFSGWDTPGVMSAGGVQIAVKTQQFLPGKSILLAGSHPFLLIVAQNILKSGGTVQGIVFSIKFPQFKELLEYGFAGLKRWHKSKELIAAFKWIMKEKIPVSFNSLPISASGKKRVESLTIGERNRNGDGFRETKTIPCDTIGVCYGFNASSELARQLRCHSYYNEVNGGWLIKTDEQMETSQPGVLAAGEITGVGGAELSEIEGRIAALNILSKIHSPNFDRLQQDRLIKKRASWNKFARMLNHATFVGDDYVSLLENAPDTVICKCEEITWGTIHDTIEANPHLASLNSIKLMTRCGMGICQGRYCERPLLEISERVLDRELIKEPFSSRYPVKPVKIADFIQSWLEQLPH